jgi:hypothetical protein
MMNKKPGNSSALVCGHIERILKVFPAREISDRGFVMKKLFALVLSALFVVGVAVPSFATDARQIALGQTGPYIEDDYNIFTWYGTLPSYSNTVWIGLTYDDYYSYLGAPAADPYMGGFQPYIGASYALGSEGKYGTLAMFFNYYGAPLNINNEGWDYNGQPYSNSLYSKWNVLYGYAMEKLSFGLYFARSDARTEYEFSSKYTVPDTTYAADDLWERAYTTIGAGVRFDIGEKMYADLAFDYSWASQTTMVSHDPDYYYNAEYGYGEVTADANKMMGFRGRAFYEYNETVTLVPYVNFQTFDFSLKGDSMKVYNRSFTTDTLDWKDTNYGVKGTAIVFGLGANVKVNENNLLLFAVEPYTYYHLEQSDPPASDFVRYDRYYYPYYYQDPYTWGVTEEATMTILPTFRLALESDVRDWLTFRIGAVKGFYKDEYKESYVSQYDADEEDDTETYKDTDTYVGSYFDYWMGLGFHVGDFDIDAVVNNNLPFRVGYWLTGYQNNYDGPPVYMLSATYHF